MLEQHPDLVSAYIRLHDRSRQVYPIVQISPEKQGMMSTRSAKSEWSSREEADIVLEDSLPIAADVNARHCRRRLQKGRLVLQDIDEILIPLSLGALTGLL